MNSNKALWKIKDKQWIKARRERWKGINEQLKYLSIFLTQYKSQIRFHKAYFLKGELLPYDDKWFKDHPFRNKNDLGRPFNLNHAFKIWYYPEVDEALFEQWGKEANQLGREEIMNFFSVVEKVGIDTEFEFFADRSIYVDQFFIPKTCEEIKKNYTHFKVEMYPKPEDILKYILSGMRVCVSASKEDCHSGRFQLAFAYELFLDCLNQVDLNSYPVRSCTTFKNHLLLIMQSILYAEQGSVYMETGLPQRLKKELPELFETGINPEVDALWGQAKAEKPEWAKPSLYPR